MIFLVLQDIAGAVRPVVEDVARAAEGSLEARLAAHSEAVQQAVDRRLRGVEGRLGALASALARPARQRQPPAGGGWQGWGRAEGGEGGSAPAGGGGGGGAGADALLPRRGGALLALPRRKQGAA